MPIYPLTSPTPPTRTARPYFDWAHGPAEHRIEEHRQGHAAITAAAAPAGVDMVLAQSPQRRAQPRAMQNDRAERAQGVQCATVDYSALAARNQCLTVVVQAGKELVPAGSRAVTAVAPDCRPVQISELERVELALQDQVYRRGIFRSLEYSATTSSYAGGPLREMALLAVHDERGTRRHRREMQSHKPCPTVERASAAGHPPEDRLVRGLFLRQNPRYDPSFELASAAFLRRFFDRHFHAALAARRWPPGVSRFICAPDQGPKSKSAQTR